MSACLDCGGSECICSAGRIIKQLTEACQLFTRGLGDAEGYYPQLGAPKTKRAIELMKAAGVKPVFYVMKEE
jgi:hypothetical protein